MNNNEEIKRLHKYGYYVNDCAICDESYNNNSDSNSDEKIKDSHRHSNSDEKIKRLHRLGYCDNDCIICNGSY